ncbi:MAG: OsmC family protein [Cytophagales bacterium]|nr:OsmC family protein [Cytophagales bacterium]
MATAKNTYLGELRTQSVHVFSGNSIITDAPLDNQGKAEAFSPTDLVSAALASCMMTIMGILANREGLDIVGLTAEVTKIMNPSPRKIQEIIVKFSLQDKTLSPEAKQKLTHAALTCPVALSLHPDIKQTVEFNW